MGFIVALHIDNGQSIATVRGTGPVDLPTIVDCLPKLCETTPGIVAVSLHREEYSGISALEVFRATRELYDSLRMNPLFTDVKLVRAVQFRYTGRQNRIFVHQACPCLN